MQQNEAHAALTVAADTEANLAIYREQCVYYILASRSKYQFTSYPIIQNHDLERSDRTEKC